MRAARYHRYGSPDVLVLEDAPEPHAPADAVRIRVLAVSVNPIDTLLRAGALAQVLPSPCPRSPAGMPSASWTRSDRAWRAYASATSSSVWAV